MLEIKQLKFIIFIINRCHQPAVIFIDEIDSLLCQRSEQEHESSRKIKTEFLVQLVSQCSSINFFSTFYPNLNKIFLLVMDKKKNI